MRIIKYANVYTLIEYTYIYIYIYIHINVYKANITYRKLYYKRYMNIYIEIRYTFFIFTLNIRDTLD